MDEKEKEFKEFSDMVNAIDKYLKDFGHPHMTIIANQQGIEILEGIKCKKLELNDLDKLGE